MPKEKSAWSGVDIGWLSSLKLTLVLFFALAASSVVGTLLPQGVGAPELRGHFSPAVVSLIDLLGFNNLYHSIWFRVLLLLLCINMVACTVDRLPKTVRLIRRPEDDFDSRKLSKFSLSASIVSLLSQEHAQSIVEAAVGESFGPLHRIGPPGPYCAVSEKGRWSRLMAFCVHGSVLIVLVGALVGSYVGFKGTMNVVEGGSSDEVLLAGEQEVKELPFTVRCDKFDVSFYDTGVPKEFKADLAIIDKGVEVLREPVVVNGPLTYQGITFYQASYGTMLKEAVVELTDSDSGKTFTMDMPFRKPVAIPGTRERLTITEYEPDLMRFGQAIEIVFEKEGQRPSGQWILVDRPFHGNRIENYQVRVVRANQVRYTGLDVKKDPGIWLVWAGFMFMTLSIGLTFYSSHRKLWVCIEPDERGEKSVVAIAGRISRNPRIFEEKFESLRARLQRELNSER